MGFKKYHGPVDTVAHAMMAHMVVTLTCQRCSRSRTIYAFRLWQMKAAAAEMPLGKAVSGFYCKGCRSRVQCVITAPARVV